MIEVNNLTKSYGNNIILKQISFKIDRGSIYGFLGKNGAGKTTTMNILTGLIRYDSGDIYIDGLKFSENKRRLLKKIGYLPENPVFYNYMNSEEYLSFIGELSNMKSKDKRIEAILESVNLKYAKKKKIGECSRGMKQRLGIAVALLNDPEIIFLDEPTSALDPEGRIDVLEIIAELKKQGKTVFLSTHILNDAERVCDYISILDKGEIIISQNLNELKKKYIQPIYDIEFENPCGDLSNRFADIKWIDSIRINKNTASIYVNDIYEAKTKLIREIAKLDNPVISYKIREASLEDIFIRMVKQNANI
ncbi:ABC transporter ATP-binding protein [Thermoanaerobacterium saccharolyticum]|uniref:ABC transporter ATP-binding protein n=1 Tax=Thermoanaerobacterium saccharolyticum TaxID=28896 RepID=UPI002FD91D7F